MTHIDVARIHSRNPRRFYTVVARARLSYLAGRSLMFIGKVPAQFGRDV
jgi:hypothetical protein